MMVTRYLNKRPIRDDSRLITSLRRYLVVGVIATGVDWALFSLFVFVMDWHYLLGGTVSFVVATFAGYLSGLRLVFRSGRHQRWVEIVFVYVASILGLAIHTSTLVVLVGGLQTHLFLAKAAATAVTFLWNFAARYFWIFDRETSNA